MFYGNTVLAHAPTCLDIVGVFVAFVKAIKLEVKAVGWVGHPLSTVQGHLVYQMCTTSKGSSCFHYMVELNAAVYDIVL